LLTATKPYHELVDDYVSLIMDDPTAARERWYDPDALAEDLQWDRRENDRLFDALKTPVGKALSITPTQLREALRRRKSKWAKQQQKTADAAEKEEKRLKKFDRVVADLGAFPANEREFIALFMAVRGYNMTWDRRYSCNDVPISVAAILNDANLTAADLALVKPRGDDLSVTNIERALAEWSDQRREAREAELWAKIARLPAGKTATAVLAEFRKVCEFYFCEPEFAFACILKYIWSVKRRFMRLDIEQVHLIALLGAQNTGKTWVCRRLLAPIEEASIECSLQDLLDNRQMDMPQYLAVFLDEMIFADRVEASAFKNLLTGQTQARRPMRSNLSEKIAVRFTGLATTNRKLGTLIFDPTGMRRFVEVTVKRRDEIEPYWQAIVDFDWTTLWQAVDEQDNTDPLISRFKSVLLAKQEEMRAPTNVELWAREFEWSPNDIHQVNLARRRDNQYVDFNSRQLHEMFRIWERQADPGYRGTSHTRFGTDLKSLIEAGSLPAWSWYPYSSKVVYRLDYVLQAKLCEGEPKLVVPGNDAQGQLAFEVEAAD
jgi:hypothetical protein